MRMYRSVDVDGSDARAAVKMDTYNRRVWLRHTCTKRRQWLKFSAVLVEWQNGLFVSSLQEQDSSLRFDRIGDANFTIA